MGNTVSLPDSVVTKSGQASTIPNQLSHLTTYNEPNGTYSETDWRLPR